MYFDCTLGFIYVLLQDCIKSLILDCYLVYCLFVALMLIVMQYSLYHMYRLIIKTMSAAYQFCPSMTMQVYLFFYF